MKTRENPLRNMARSQLEEDFSDLSPQTQDELETAIVRQWITYDGHAGVCTAIRNARFKLVKEGDSYHVGRTVCQSRVPVLLRARGARAEGVPGVASPREPLATGGVHSRRRTNVVLDHRPS
jgi:hypothetical protein